MQNAKLAALAALAMTAGSAFALVERKLPAMTVVESETVSVDAMNAADVRSANQSVFTAALRESGEAVVTGVRLGEARLLYVDGRGIFASRPVTVVPAYWDILRRMFSEDPEIMIDIVGDKVVVDGATANVETLRRVGQAKELDPARIVTQVSYSAAQVGELVTDFLSRAGATNITARVIGREVCLYGSMYDAQSIEQLKNRVASFLKDFPGITVNGDELKVLKQKILIDIEFLSYNDTIARNLGFAGPESITASLNWDINHDYGYKRDYERKSTTTGGHQYFPPTSSTSSSEGTGGGEGGGGGTTTTTTPAHTDKKDNVDRTRDFGKSLTQGLTSSAKVGVTGVQATINLLKRNGAAKTLYATTLSTQSGIEAEFQNGGTIYRTTPAGISSSGDVREIEFGYIIKTTPYIIDANTINLEFNLDNKQDVSTGNSYDDLRLSRYQTKSKYLVRPGESIALSAYDYTSENETKRGTPWLSRIPFIGEYLFGNTEDNSTRTKMLLVVTVNWSVEGDSAETRRVADEIKDRKVEVEMP